MGLVIISPSFPLARDTVALDRFSCFSSSDARKKRKDIVI